MTREELVENVGEELVFADGMDEALIGHVSRGSNDVALYDANKCIEILQTRDEMSEEDAREFFYINILQAWVGDKTPAFAFIG